MKDRETLESKLFDDFLEKDLTIILKGNINTEFVIHSAKLLMSNNTLMITDSKKEELIISFNDVIDIDTNSFIKIQFENQSVIIDF